MGLEKIRSLSKQGPYQLQVELSDGAGQQLPVVRYGFQLDGEEKKFALQLEDETASPPFTTGSSGIPFSTADRDNDLAVDVNCAELLSGMTPPSTPEQRVNGHKHLILLIAFLLQAVGGSAAAAAGTLTADIPEGRAHRAESSRGNPRCFGRHRDEDGP